MSGDLTLLTEEFTEGHGGDGSRMTSAVSSVLNHLVKMAQKLSGGKNVVNDRDKDVINDNIPASATDQLTHNHEGKNTDRVVLLLYCLLTIVCSVTVSIVVSDTGIDSVV